MLSGRNKDLFRIPQQIVEPGIYRYEIRLKAEHDYSVENNTREVWITVQGPPRILMVDENPEELQNLASALRYRGFQVDLRSPSEFPISIQDMLLYQAVFVRNIPASRIHDQMPLVQQYVRDFGGGFAMLGGRKSFGPGGYFHTPIEETLPVQMDLTNKKYLADVAMVIVIDKSGSMSYADKGRQKIDLADEGGARIISLLKKSDQFGALAVDSVPKWAFALQRLTNPLEAESAITSIRAGGGGIYVYSGLREGYAALRKSQASVKHVILFADSADCEEKDGPDGEPSQSIALKALRDDKITTTTIGIGQPGDSDVDFLKQVAAVGEGRFYFTNDMYTLPEIFTQESAVVQRYYINEEPFTPRITEQEPLLTGIDAVPELLGYVATTAKSVATTELISPHDEPILSSWRYGLGQAVAFTSDPTAAWGKPWLDWPEYQRVWTQISRYLARDNVPARFRTSFAAESDHTTIVVEAQDDRSNFVNGADFRGVFTDSSGAPVTVHFSQTAPGRYEATTAQKGSLFGKIFRLDQGGEESIVQFTAKSGREYENTGGGRERLQQLTGRVLDSPSELRFNNGMSVDIQPLRSQLLLWAAILFIVDIAARKIDFRAIKLPQKELKMEPVAAGPLQQLKGIKKGMERKSALPVFEIEEVEMTPAPEPPTIMPEEPGSEYMQRLKDAKKRK